MRVFFMSVYGNIYIFILFLNKGYIFLVDIEREKKNLWNIVFLCIRIKRS